MAFHTKTLMGLAALVAIASWAVAQEQQEPEMVDNPQYASWASFAIGASATWSVASATAEGVTGLSMSETRTLKALEDDHAEITMQTTMTVGGEATEMPLSIPAQVAAAAQEPPEGVEIEIEQGTATIEVPAGTFECEFIKTTMTMTMGDEEITSVTTTWTNSQVPGGVVKMVSVSQGHTLTRELLEYSDGSE